MEFLDMEKFKPYEYSLFCLFVLCNKKKYERTNCVLQPVFCHRHTRAHAYSPLPTLLASYTLPPAFWCGGSGWPVMESTRSMVRPCNVTVLGLHAINSLIGRYTIRLLHKPVENAVKPAMTPWTAFCPNMSAYRLSNAFAGTLRICIVI